MVRFYFTEHVDRLPAVRAAASLGEKLRTCTLLLDILLLNSYNMNRMVPLASAAKVRPIIFHVRVPLTVTGQRQILVYKM
jgi:hypothetical protein